MLYEVSAPWKQQQSKPVNDPQIATPKIWWPEGFSSKKKSLGVVLQNLQVLIRQIHVLWLKTKRVLGHLEFTFV